MKYTYIIIIILYAGVTSSRGQDNSKFLLENIKVNFAVPDLPAFKAMGTESSNLLRPSTTEAISAILPQFWSNGRGVLPSSLAVEIAPFYVAHQKDNLPMTLMNYIDNSFWKSFRISLSTSSDSTQKEPSAIKLGLGLRFSIINKGDLKSDIKYLENKANLSMNRAVFNGYKRNYARINNIDDIDEAIRNDNTLEDKIKEFVKLNYNLDILTNSEIMKNTEKFIKDYKQKNWNAEKLDIAFALVTRSPDQFTSNLKFNKFSTWITYARPCKDWGQLLVGGNYSNASAFSDKEKKDINFSDWSLSSRMYVGSNNFKGFIEAQYTYKGFDSSKNWFTYLGLETVVMNGIWLHLYGGYQAGDTVSQVVSNLDFRFTLPEK